jgi:hypothetical protein
MCWENQHLASILGQADRWPHRTRQGWLVLQCKRQQRAAYERQVLLQGGGTLLGALQLGLRTRAVRLHAAATRMGFGH